MAMQRRDPHRACQVERFQHTTGVQAGRYALIDDNASSLIFAHGIGRVQIRETNADDQVAEDARRPPAPQDHLEQEDHRQVQPD